MEHEDDDIEVKRDNEWVTKKATELVPGDIIKIKEGIVPADIILLSSEDLKVNMVSITGVSEEVEK